MLLFTWLITTPNLCWLAPLLANGSRFCWFGRLRKVLVGFSPFNLFFCTGGGKPFWSLKWVHAMWGHFNLLSLPVFGCDEGGSSWKFVSKLIYFPVFNVFVPVNVNSLQLGGRAKSDNRKCNFPNHRDHLIPFYHRAHSRKRMNGIYNSGWHIHSLAGKAGGNWKRENHSYANLMAVVWIPFRTVKNPVNGSLIWYCIPSTSI